MTTGTIFHGDCLDVMRTWPDGCINCCVTSPPYYGLRDYGVDGQIGLEPTPEQYIARLVDVFREVRRVLKPDGTLWLNLGDSYNSGASGGLGGSTLGGGQTNQANSNRHGKAIAECCKPKDLLMIPAQVALALRADGWYLRSDIIWAKPNPMPESVRDRPTSAHEHIFLLSKGARYFYDATAIAEPVTASSMERLGQNVDGQKGSERANGGAKTNGPMKAVCFGGTKGSTPGSDLADNRKYSGNEWKPARAQNGHHAEAQKGVGRPHQQRDGSQFPNQGLTRNSRNVWTIATQPCKEAHFATFPITLATRCIRAGCPHDGVVLDPFMGAGSTAIAAEQQGRQWVGVELSPEYIPMAERRISAARPSAPKREKKGKACGDLFAEPVQ